MTQRSARRSTVRLPRTASEPRSARRTQASVQGFGPGKVILLGEHGVVYGYPALVGPLSLGVTATGTPSAEPKLVPLDGLSPSQRTSLFAAFERALELCGRPSLTVRVKSDLPISMGLGSSAALSVAVVRALLAAQGEKAAPQRVAALALAMEKEFHGTPSGVDHTCSALGQLIEYRREPGTELGRARAIKSPRPLGVVVALAGERTGTKATVAALRERRGRWPVRYERLFAEVGRLVEESVKAVQRGDLESLGDAMNVNHGLLSALGLSSARLDQMVYRLRDAGALGSKLTGAGGDGGAVIGLFEEPEKAAAKLRREGVSCFASQLAGTNRK